MTIRKASRLVVLFIGFFYSQFIYSTHLNLATLDDFKPFVWCNGAGAQGIDVEIIRELARRTGFTFKIRCYPWARALENVQYGVSDGAFSAFKTETRERYAFFSNTPLHVSTFKVFVRKDHQFVFNQLEDLYQRNIGLVRNFTISSTFDQAVQRGQIHVEAVVNTEQNIKKLIKGRIDAFVENEYVALYTIKQMGLSEQIVALAKPVIQPREAYLIVSKAAKYDRKSEVMVTLNQTLSEMMNDGSISQITAHFISK
ncbi:MULTISPECIES: substrate-binding periplasmic protein [unclassified Agarivorans]|uniref:substrate-binding periplasmic protein n=1 Tax=unclassified Agarivorans TaxID=2636026 RepID=UPI003D7CBE70